MGLTDSQHKAKQAELPFVLFFPYIAHKGCLCVIMLQCPPHNKLPARSWLMNFIVRIYFSYACMHREKFLIQTPKKCVYKKPSLSMFSTPDTSSCRYALLVFCTILYFGSPCWGIENFKTMAPLTPHFDHRHTLVNKTVIFSSPPRPTHHFDIVYWG